MFSGSSHDISSRLEPERNRLTATSACRTACWRRAAGSFLESPAPALAPTLDEPVTAACVRGRVPDVIRSHPALGAGLPGPGGTRDRRSPRRTPEKTFGRTEGRGQETPPQRASATRRRTALGKVPFTTRQAYRCVLSCEFHQSIVTRRLPFRALKSASISEGLPSPAVPL